jgi:anti-anti-sigma factor
MEISKIQAPSKVIIYVTGHIDTLTSTEFQNEVISEFSRKTNVEFDFSAVEYISSAGLRVLLICQKKAQENNIDMSISNVPESVAAIFNMTGFNKILKIV